MIYSPPVRKRHFSPQRQHLITLMQQLGFGSLHGLLIRDGQPVLADRMLRIVREIKFGAEESMPPAAQTADEDFALKSQVVHLFRSFDRVRNGRVETLTVKHGLPFHMAVEVQR